MFQISLRIFLKMKVDKRALIKKRQLPRHHRPLTQRSSLYLLPVLKPFLSTDRERTRVCLLANKRSQTTLSGWNRSIQRFIDFLSENNKTVYQISEDILLDYIILQEVKKTSYGILIGQRTAIKFLLSALKLPSVWSADVTECYLTVLKRSSSEKGQPRKANVLELAALLKASETYVVPFLNNIDEVCV